MRLHISGVAFLALRRQRNRIRHAGKPSRNLRLEKQSNP